MRIWVDITDGSAVVFFAPIVRRLEEGGHTVTLTARRFAGADLILRRYGLGGVLTTQHRGGSLGTRAVGLVNRTAQLLVSASSGHFDVAAGSHASDFVLTAWTLAIPQMTFLDDERLGRGNAVSARLVDEIAVPDAVPAASLAALGVPQQKAWLYPGFKEEYYLHDARPDPEALRRLGVDRRRIVGVVRPAASGSPSPGGSAAAGETALGELLRELAGRRRVTLVVVARDREQRRRFLALELPGVLVPDGPVDGVGLLAAADFMLGLEGAMTREAAALGTPAYTFSQRRATAVDATLLADGRLKRATGPDDVALRKKDTRTAAFAPRDPGLFAGRLLHLAGRDFRRARRGRLIQDATDEPPTPLV